MKILCKNCNGRGETLFSPDQERQLQWQTCIVCNGKGRIESMAPECECCGIKADLSKEKVVVTTHADLGTEDLCFSCWAKNYSDHREDVMLEDLLSFLSRGDCQDLYAILDRMKRKDEL